MTCRVNYSSFPLPHRNSQLVPHPQGSQAALVQDDVVQSSQSYTWFQLEILHPLSPTIFQTFRYYVSSYSCCRVLNKFFIEAAPTCSWQKASNPVWSVTKLVPASIEGGTKFTEFSKKSTIQRMLLQWENMLVEYSIPKLLYGIILPQAPTPKTVEHVLCAPTWFLMQ